MNVSALERLHIKQAEMTIRDGKPVPQHIINRSDELQIPLKLNVFSILSCAFIPQ